MMLARRPPNWGPFRQASGLGWIIRRRIRAGRAWASLALIEPVAVAVHFQDMDVMGEPVEQRTGEPLVGVQALDSYARAVKEGWLGVRLAGPVVRSRIIDVSGTELWC